MGKYERFNYLIGQRKPVEILVVLRRNHNNYFARQISLRTGMTYAHTNHCIKELIRLKLIKGKKEGRKIILSLTKKGEEITDKFIELKELLR